MHSQHPGLPLTVGIADCHFHAKAADSRAMKGFVPFEAFDALEDRLLAHGLHLQLLTDSRLLPDVAARIERSKLPVVIDHMGRTPAALGAQHAGIVTLSAVD